MTETVKQNGVNSAARVRAGKNRRRTIIKVIIVLALLISAGVTWKLVFGKPKETDGLVSATVERRDLTQIISATGSVTAQTGAQVNIGSQITGRIKHLYADVGSKVQAGQVIAELDLPDLEAQVQQSQASLSANRSRLVEELSGVNLQETQTRTAIDQAQASVSAAEAGFNQAQANADNSAANLARVQQLFDKGYISAAEVDSAKAQAKVDAAQVVSAQEQIKQAQASLSAAKAGSAQNRIKQQQVATARATVAQSQAGLAYQQAQMDKAFIRTPISGTVLQLAQQEGETIAAGLSAPTVIIVADLTRLQVDAFVDETDIGRVKLGQRAEVTVDAYPDRPFSGRVEKIASSATLQENVVTYNVTIALSDPGELLKPDMTASVNITVEKREKVLAVPVDAVKQSAQGTTVTVMEQQGKQTPIYKVVPVEVGISDEQYTEITRGLQEGQVVVLSGEVPGMTASKDAPRMPSLFGGGRGGRR
jgi:RND family efflux transporter MFP subunit